MSLAAALIGFILAAGLLTVTPGVDTAMVLRTATVEGRRPAALAALGICLGCLAWGGAVALGLGALLAASEAAYTALKWVGGGYLVWLGLKLILEPRSSLRLEDRPVRRPAGDLAWFGRGFATNLLNPKMGVFYVSFLPQFTPAGADVRSFAFLLASIHAAMGLAWLGLLIVAAASLGRALARPSALQTIDRLTGGLFIALGARLALADR